MITAELVNGTLHLVCKEDHVIEFLGSIHEPVTIKQGQVGAVVTGILELGTSVNWWAGKEVIIGKNVVIDNCVIEGVAVINPLSVLVNSYISSPNTFIDSRIEHLTGIRNSVLEGSSNLHILCSDLQRVEVFDCTGCVIVDSEIDETQLRGAITVVHSTIKMLHTFPAVETEVEFETIMGQALKREGLFDGANMVISLIRATVNDLKVSPRSSCVVVQCSSVKHSVFDGDITLLTTMISESELVGNCVHVINCIFGKMQIKFSAPVSTVVNERKMEENLSTEYIILNGSYHEQVVAN